MKIQENVISKSQLLPKNGDEIDYKLRLEAHLINLLRKKQLTFQEIVCQGNGAYPSDILQALKNLVQNNKLELHNRRYRTSGDKPSKKSNLEVKNSPIITEKQLVLKPLNVNSVFGDPHPADYDWRYTSKSRDELTIRLRPFIEANCDIALLGAPTLFLSLYRLGVHMTLFDNSVSVLNDLKAEGIENGLIHHNMFDPLTEFEAKFDVVVSDPPWYVPFYKAFILRSSELLKNQGLLLISVPQWLTRPSAVTDRMEIIKFATDAGFDLVESAPGILSYQTPKFEQIDLAMQGIHCGNWRQGDLFVFRKINKSRASLKVSPPKDEPTWDEYRFGLLKIKLRHRTNHDSGELKIVPVSSGGIFLGTVSRRSPLRRLIDLWTSDNIAYSVTRLDIVKAAMDRLIDGDSPKAIVDSQAPQLSTREHNILLKLLNNITIPYEEDEFEQVRKSKKSAKEYQGNQDVPYINKLIKENILPSISNHYWQERLGKFLLNGSNPNAIHLAIFVEPYLKFILEGKKTVESRFSSNRCAPYQKVQVGDILLLKRSSGPIVGLCEVSSVWFYKLDPESWENIKKEFAKDLCVQDPNFWENRKHALYATLMRIQNVLSIAPANISKYDRRGWVLLTANKYDSQIEFYDR
ncbi:ASCH domain-containing protein [Dehalococcoides sp.]|uniref:ASCH domain-containing protein n=1 Tax=Dehalococcoides sp. TaxID=1966486 RepID=UPI002ACB06D2|nr:ASCH domain-containing protein [Dehalococcoides sp.]